MVKGRNHGLAVQGDENLQQVLREPFVWVEEHHDLSPISKGQATEAFEDLAKAEDRATSDYSGRYAIELLQNAHDASADYGKPGLAWFSVTNTALLVGNQGEPFNEKRLRSLMRFGSSEKAKDHASRSTIGYKGIGFSAVFEICTTPQIWSESVAFEFDRVRANALLKKHLGKFAERVPSRRFPFEIDADDLGDDADEVERLLDLGAVTVIRLPFKPQVNPEDVSQVLAETLTPEALIFMPALKSLEITAPDHREIWTVSRKRRGKSQIVTLKCSDETKTRSWRVLMGEVPADRTTIRLLAEEEDAWRDVKKLNVAVGIPWKKNRPFASGDGQNLRVYFPTEDQLARSVLVHGDFVVQSNRRYVRQEGVGQTVNESIAQGASDLLVELAEEIAQDLDGPELLECLSTSDGTSQGFGELIDGLIDESLSDARIVPAAEGDRRHKAEELERIGLETVRSTVQLLPLLEKRRDLVSPVVDVGNASILLEELGSEELTYNEIAERIDVRRAQVEYQAALRALKGFVKQVAEDDLDGVVSCLSEIEIFQYREGGKVKWSRPTAIFRRVPKSPELPASIRPPEFSPDSPVEKDLARALRVREMTPEVAVGFVLSEINRSKALSKTKTLGFLSFLRDLWHESPKVLENFKKQLGIVPVPVVDGKGKEGSPRALRADRVYFPEAWSPDSPVERIYAGFRQGEFLVAPSKLSGYKEEIDFFRMLGVADEPRVVAVSIARDFHHPGVHLEGWVEQTEVHRAWVCPDGHHYTNRGVEYSTIDRLEEILKDSSRQTRRELAKYLSGLSNPFGGKAKIQCLHSSHRSRNSKEVPGYQRFMLQEFEWVPVKHDPLGKPSRRPRESWLPFKENDNFQLPTADLPKESAKGLGFVRSAAPGPESLMAALNDLAEANSDLEEAPKNAMKTAEWLVARLDRSLKKNTSFEITKGDVHLPARIGSTNVWSDDPLVADLPGLEAFAAIEVLSPGRWNGLRRRLELRPASEALEVKPGFAVQIGTHLLPEIGRAQLAALLVSRGADPDRIYSRLGRLIDQPVRNLELEISHGNSGESSTSQLESYIQQTLTSHGRLQRAELLWVSSQRDDGLIRQIAHQLDDYIGAELELYETIHLFLIEGPEKLRHEDVEESDVKEALREIRSKSANAGKHDLSEYADEWVENDEEFEPKDDLENINLDEPEPDDEADPGTTVNPRPERPEPEVHPIVDEPFGDDEEQLLPPDDDPTKFPQLDRGKAKAPPEIDLGTAGIAPPRADSDTTIKPKRGSKGTDWNDREKRNQKVGNRGEEWALDCERDRLKRAGLDPANAKWISQEIEDSPYDIESIELDGSPRYIEVKTTTGTEIGEPFEMSEREFQFARKHGDQHILCRVADASLEAPKTANYRNIASLVDHENALLERSQVRISLPPRLAER